MAPARLGITVGVLGYREADGWIALALEMDLRGRGATFEKALANLQVLVSMQISFALFKGQPQMIWRPADSIFFERFAEERRSRFESLAEAPRDSDRYEVAGLPIPPAHVIDALRKGYCQADA